MKFLVGSEKVFLDFVNSITKKDRVAILSHTDCDGVSSAVILEQILNAKKIKPALTELLNYDKYMLEKMAPKLRNLNINKVFVCDLALDNDNLDLFEAFRKEFNTLLIDHHPPHPDLKNKQNILKAISLSETGDCTTMIVYELGKNLFDYKKWTWLVCAATIADFYFKNPKNLRLIKKLYPGTNEEKIFESKPGKFALAIDFSLIYYKEKGKPLLGVFNLIKKKDIKSLERCRKTIQKKIDVGIKDYLANAEFYPEKNLYFYYNSSVGAESSAIIASIISNKYHPDKTIILLKASSNPGFIRINLRNQEGDVDTNLLVKKGTVGLEHASGGGHAKASGGQILQKDVDKFRANILAA